MEVLKYIGAAYILWLAIHIAFSKPSTENAEQSASFLKGFMLQFVNVKIYMFGVTALTGYVVGYMSSFPALLFFELVIATIGTIATFSVHSSLFQYSSETNIATVECISYGHFQSGSMVLFPAMHRKSADLPGKWY